MSYKSIILIVTVMLFFTGCSTAGKITKDRGDGKLTYIMKERGVSELAFIDEKGKFFVVDTIKGKVIPPCSKRPTKDFAACKSPFKKIINKLCPRFKFNKANKKITQGLPKILAYNNICVIDWVGSHCRTFIDRSTGDEIERCYPPH